MNHKGFIPIVAVAILISAMAIGLVGAAWYYQAHGGTVAGQGVVISNFEQCVAAGNAVLKSDPPKCQANGKTFTEVIANSNSNSNTNSATNGNTNAAVDTTGWKTYTQPQGEYRALYPSDWIDKTCDDGWSGFSWKTIPCGTDVTGLIGVSRNSIMLDIPKQIAQSKTGLVNPIESTLLIDGVSASRLSGIMEKSQDVLGGGGWYIDQVFLTRNNITWILSYTENAAQAESRPHQNEFNAFLTKLTFTK